MGFLLLIPGTDADRRKCAYIDIDYEAFASYNLDDANWMVSLFWGGRPNCKVSLAMGTANNGPFKAHITNKCKTFQLKHIYYMT